MLICFDPAFKMVCFCFDVHFARNSPFGVGCGAPIIYFIYFYFFVGWATFFFDETISKKVDPDFADRFGQSGRAK